MDSTPKILCSLYFSFKDGLDVNEIVDYLSRIDIDKITYGREPGTNDHSLRVLHLDYKEFWSIGDALVELFANLDDFRVHSLAHLLAKYRGSAFLDIAFYQYGTYPSLCIMGRNMEIIRELKADISIAPY